ncbi:MAG TPA: O-antigen ligase family protein [Thermoanaerobaculia bacterium]
MQSPGWSRVAEGACLASFLVWLMLLPLPFGSVIEAARVPLIVVPLAVCACAALIRLRVTRDRTRVTQATPPAIVLTGGAVVLLLIVALQLVPLPSLLLRAISPESHLLWSEATRLAALAGTPVSTMHPISIDPRATGFELFRLFALFATFMAAALLIRTHPRRVVFTYALCVTAMFESMYGLREAAMQRYEIWGWVNRLNFDRVTGTFVNPNHFGHYLAIVLPLPLFLVGVALHRAGDRETPFARRLAGLLEHGLLRTSFALIAAGACLAGILLSASRGALLALVAGVLLVASLIPGRRITRIAFAAMAAGVLIAALVLFLGPERTMSRFMPSAAERQTFVGRKVGISAALGVWNRFPFTGSGAGTFERVVSMEQRDDLGKIYHHAHNDYAELAATGGSLALVVGLLALLAGYVLLWRMTFSRAGWNLTWRRRAFQAAALTSLSIAMIHALFDFNFYIPSNPATLAAILGVAVASTDHDKRNRR